MRRFRRRRRAFLDLAEHGADPDRVAGLGRDVAEHAGGRRRHLQRDLVGFEFDQRLVDRDRLAGLLEPLADGRFGDAFAQRGDADLSHRFVRSAERLFQELLELREMLRHLPDRGRGRRRTAGVTHALVAWRRSG